MQSQTKHRSHRVIAVYMRGEGRGERAGKSREGRNPEAKHNPKKNEARQARTEHMKSKGHHHYHNRTCFRDQKIITRAGNQLLSVGNECISHYRL